jgi:3-oxoacyl-[acyl-carrier protein] reductase
MLAEVLAARQLHGRVAIVTGAGSGIGARSAEFLAAAGAAVVVADVDDSRGAQVAQGIRDGGGEAEFVLTDTSRQHDVQACVAHAVERYGQLDVMANVAGIAGDGLVADLTEADLDRVLAVNLKGVFFGCQAAIRAMVPRRTGSIVNVSSAAIDFPAPGNAAYAMSKAAVAMLTMTLAVEVGPHGIRVNTIAPGVTITNFTLRHLVGADGRPDPARLDERVEQLRQMSPLGLVGEADDQAHLVLYLASDASKYATGAIFRANGGVGIGW